MMAAMAAAVRATSALRLVSETGLFGRPGLVVDELAGGLVAGAVAGTADGVGVGSTAAATNATGLEKLDADDAVRTDEVLMAGGS
jgi:hypothetical protein